MDHSQSLLEKLGFIIPTSKPWAMNLGKSLLKVFSLVDLASKPWTMGH